MLGGEIGQMSAEGFGAIFAGNRSTLWGSVLAGLVVSVPLAQSWALRMIGEASIAIDRPRFVLDPLGEVYRPAPVAGRAWFALEYRF
jgi:hypothetical protein